jgi:hypothetical protein
MSGKLNEQPKSMTGKKNYRNEEISGLDNPAENFSRHRVCKLRRHSEPARAHHIILLKRILGVGFVVNRTAALLQNQIERSSEGRCACFRLVTNAAGYSSRDTPFRAAVVFGPTGTIGFKQAEVCMISARFLRFYSAHQAVLSIVLPCNSMH